MGESIQKKCKPNLLIHAPKREKSAEDASQLCEMGDDSAEERKEYRRVQKTLASYVKWETIAEGVGESRIVEGREFQVTKQW